MSNLNMGAFIARHRKTQNLTQKQLADKLNVTDKAVSKWERGQGYPDITMLTALAEALDVPVSDLLNGRDGDEPADSPPPDGETITRRTLDYASLLVKASRGSFTGPGKLVISLVSLVGIVTCLICNLAVNGGITWAVYPVASIIFAWLVGMPLLHLKKHRILISLGVFTALVLPLLWVIAWQQGGGWFGSIALPIAAISLVYMWVVIPIAVYTRISVWYKCAIAVALATAVSLAIEMIMRHLQLSVNSAPQIIISAISTLLGAVLLAALGWFFNRRKKGRG